MSGRLVCTRTEGPRGVRLSSILYKPWSRTAAVVTINRGLRWEGPRQGAPPQRPRGSRRVCPLLPYRARQMAV